MSVGLPVIAYRFVGKLLIERLHADAGYRGHNAPLDYQFKV
jgi:hypothetical protein